MTMPFFLEGNKRFPIEPVQLTTGFTAHIIHTRLPLLINEDQGRIAKEMGTREYRR